MKRFVVLFTIFCVYQVALGDEMKAIKLFFEAIIPKSHYMGKIKLEYEFGKGDSGVKVNGKDEPDCNKESHETSSDNLLTHGMAVDVTTQQNMTNIETSNLLTHGMTQQNMTNIETNYTDCEDVPSSKGSGVYTINLNGSPKSVYCEFENDGTTYLIIQRRLNGHQNFYRNWSDYEQGFGDPAEEFWIGNKALSQITSGAPYKLRIELESFDSIKVYAQYESFSVGSPDTKYTLDVSGYTGTAGDSLTHQNGQKFSTHDQDNDAYSTGSCAELYKGGWWYGQCHKSNLNGFYYNGKHSSYADGINWSSFRSYHESMKNVFMKIQKMPTKISPS